MSRLAAALAMTLSVACSRLEPPTLTPEGASIASIKPDEIDVVVELDASNPNGLELSATAVKAKITVENKADVGAVVASEPLTLAPRKRAHVEVPFSVKWADPAQLASLADPPRTVNYTVDGAVEFAAHGMTVQTPFSFKGTLSHDQIAQAMSPRAPAPPPAPASAAPPKASADAGKPRRR